MTGFERVGVVGAGQMRAPCPRLSFTSELKDLGDRDIVIEAVYEDPAAKTEVVARLDEVVGAEVILASNTSSIPIIDLAMATKRADRSACTSSTRFPSCRWSSSSHR